MSALAHRVRYSYAEYLALEASSNVQHEYFDGQIYGMAGGSPEHAGLAAAIVGLLFPQPAVRTLLTPRAAYHRLEPYER